MAKPTFALVGLGFIAQRHIDSVECLNGQILMACDIDTEKAKKIPGAKFFKNYDEMLADPLFREVNYLSIATPNHLHGPMIQRAAPLNKTILCEKPLAIRLAEYREITALDRLFVVMQLRENRRLQELQASYRRATARSKVRLSIRITRDQWYFKSWKNNFAESGGLLFNIGVHYFDILTWFFGAHQRCSCVAESQKLMHGTIDFKTASAEWEISLEAPHDNQQRLLQVDDTVIPLNNGLEMLHRDVYERLVRGEGVRPRDLADTYALVTALNDIGHVEQRYS